MSEAASPDSRRPRIALTGGVAEGKSTVLRYLHDLGVSTLSSDAVAAEVYASPEAQRDVALALGLDPPANGATLDRAQVREALSQDPGARRRLNAAMHPRILAVLRASSAQVIEVPLLLETCLQGVFSFVWVVTCGPAEQRERLIRRLGDQQAADSLIATQLITPIKCSFADAVIRTDQPEDSVFRDVRELVRVHGRVLLPG